MDGAAARREQSADRTADRAAICQPLEGEESMRRLGIFRGALGPTARRARLRLLRGRPDAVESLLANAPIAKEPLTDDEAAAMDEGRRAYLGGESAPLADVRRELLRETGSKKTPAIV